MAFFTLSLFSTNLCRNAFSTGYLRWTDETKVQVFLAAKTFLMLFLLLSYTEGAATKFLGMDLLGAHHQLVARINTIANLGGSSMEIAPEFTYSILAMLAALTTFVMTKVNINFAFYFFVINRTASGSDVSDSQEINPKGHTF